MTTARAPPHTHAYQGSELGVEQLAGPVDELVGLVVVLLVQVEDGLEEGSVGLCRVSCVVCRVSCVVCRVVSSRVSWLISGGGGQCTVLSGMTPM